jgi:uncharacterized damage-inducible protein DinB
MKRLFLMFLLVTIAIPALGQEQKTPTLKSILLDQLRSTHNTSDWFVCADVAVAGLTAEQASWTDGKGNHSVGQLVNHLAFWNERQLEKLTGQKQAQYSGNNDETFNSFDAKQWDATVKQLDQVLTDWEKAVESADDKKLAEWASTIAHIGAHNAYHIGQIIYIRKEQGSWDPSKGVK